MIHLPAEAHQSLLNTYITLPSLPCEQEEVRKHFDCPTLEGAELEDQGEDGTILTHWEKRVFEVRIRLE